MDKVYKSKVDWWLRVALCIPIGGAALAIILGITRHQSTSIFIGLGALAFYGAILLLLILPITYTVAGDGLRVRFGRMNLAVPWDRLIKVEPSSNPLSSPALSLRRLNVEYRKPNGKETYVLISPTDREQFVKDLAAASPRHRLDGDRLVEK